MTLAETLLEKLADWKPTGSLPCRLVVTDPASRASAELAVEKLDSLACSLRSVTVVPDDETTAKLADRARNIAGRVTGLMEPLKLIEVDAAKGQALLRSEKPAQ